MLAATLAGVVLVMAILWLNLTVAAGTLNGLFLYANIVFAKNVLLPFQKPNIQTVFISWMNLDFGLDVCFISGLDTYTKTWLQLAFPTYLILLVLVVIFVSKISTRFAKLIGRRNPIATLATLILLSNAKLLHGISLQHFHILT